MSSGEGASGNLPLDPVRSALSRGTLPANPTTGPGEEIVIELKKGKRVVVKNLDVELGDDVITPGSELTESRESLRLRCCFVLLPQSFFA